MNLVMLGAVSDFCTSTAGMLKFIGIAVWILKVAIPIIVFAMGMIDLGKAATAGKDDEIKKCMKQLGVRIIAGVLIFFVPTIIMFVFRIITEFNDIEGNVGFNVCEACILRPTSSDCSDNGQIAM